MEIKEWENKPINSIVLPAIDEIRQLGRATIGDLAIGSYEFARVMRKLIDKIVVHPYQLIDGGKIVLRATFTLHLAKLISDPRAQEALDPLLKKTLTIDLFETPQRVAYRERVMELRKKFTEDEVARMLGITANATQCAAALDRLMQEKDLYDPYLPLTKPPANGKLRRHLHPRYKFNPLPEAPAD